MGDPLGSPHQVARKKNREVKRWKKNRWKPFGGQIGQYYVEISGVLHYISVFYKINFVIHSGVFAN